nr:GNAT family N-acetyltransferase [uncultured Oscillibacter sp.]
MDLKLEPLSMAHLSGLEALWSDPAVIRYTNLAEPCDGDAAALRLERLRSYQTLLPGPTIFAVLGDGRFCGIAGCPPVDEARGTFGLFYQLLPEVWGRGVGLTAAGLALAELYRMVPTATVYADAVAENTASVRILEHLDFVRTAVRPGAFRRDGRTMDIWDYVRSPGMKKEERL